MIKQIFKLIWRKKGSNALLLIEILLSFLVLFAVIAYVKNNMDKLNNPLGFETTDRWLVKLSDFQEQDSTDVANKLTVLKRELLQLDEIEAVSFSWGISTFSNSMSLSSTEDNGFEMTSSSIEADTDIGPTLGIELLEGRWFEEEDQFAKYPPMIVGKDFMDEYYPGKTMIDSIVKFRGEKKIVGVMGGFKYMGALFDEYHNSLLYLPATSKRVGTAYLKMKPGVNVQFEEELSQLISSITKSNDFIIKNIDEQKDFVYADTWISIIALSSVSIFLCINVALGLFGVLWYNINRRRSEIGLRRALGAHSSQITQQFILETMILAGIAVFVGLFFAIQIPLLKVTEMPDTALYYSMAVSVLIIFTLVFICAYYPSRQAAKISPAKVLHGD